MHERVKGRFVVIWSFIHEMLHDMLSFTTRGHTRPPICSSESVTSEHHPSSPTPLRMTHSWCSSHFAARWYQWRTGYCASHLDNMGDHIGCNKRANALAFSRVHEGNAQGTSWHVSEAYVEHQIIKEDFKWIVWFACYLCSSPILCMTQLTFH